MSCAKVIHKDSLSVSFCDGADLCGSRHSFKSYSMKTTYSTGLYKAAQMRALPSLEITSSGFPAACPAVRQLLQLKLQLSSRLLLQPMPQL